MEVEFNTQLVIVLGVYFSLMALIVALVYYFYRDY